MRWIRFPGAHDAERFEEVYKKYYRTVYNYAYRILLNRQNAEDVVSETFLKAMESFSRYDRNKGALSTWLCGIARNCAIDFLRSAAVRTSLSLEELLERGEFPEDSRNEWEEDTAEWEAWEILRRLRVSERELLSLRYAWGLSNKEIGVRLGVTEHAVDERFHRVLAKCRKIVKRASEEMGTGVDKR